jgi:hypothetical protein
MRSGLRLAFIALGACAYVGLAVLGWGGFRPFFSHPALVALVVVLFALSVVSFFAGGNLSPGVREARSNRWVIAVFAVSGFLNAYLPAYTDRKDFWTIDGDTGEASLTSVPSRFAGSVSCSLLPVVRCGSGRSLCWASDSAAWSRSSPGTRS